MRTRLALVGAGIVAATVGLTGCGGESNGATGEFCDALTTMDSYLPDSTLTEADQRADWESRLDAVESTAPRDIEATARKMVEDTRAYEPEDTDGMSADTLSAHGDVDDWALDNCDLVQQLVVTVSDYDLEGVPATLPTGRVAVTLHNTGLDVHMLQFVRIEDPLNRTAEQLLAMPREQHEPYFIGGPAAFVTGGISDTAFLELPPGRYIALDPLSIGTVDPATAGWGEPHYTRGIYAQVEVTGTAKEDS